MVCRRWHFEGCHIEASCLHSTALNKEDTDLPCKDREQRYLFPFTWTIKDSSCVCHKVLEMSWVTVRPYGSVETPVPSITEVKQHWDGSVPGWVRVQVTCLLYDLSRWLSDYINVECCVRLSVVLVTKRPLGANCKEQDIVSWTWVSTSARYCHNCVWNGH